MLRPIPCLPVRSAYDHPCNAGSGLGSEVGLTAEVVLVAKVGEVFVERPFHKINLPFAPLLRGLESGIDNLELHHDTCA